MDILLGLALSTHLGLNNDYNEIHPHIRLQHENWIGGFFYNSDNAVSTYGGVRLEPNVFGIEGFDQFGLEVGIANGYDGLSPIVPFGRGTYDVNDTTTLFVAPAPERNEDDTINMGVVFGTEFNF